MSWIANSDDVLITSYFSNLNLPNLIFQSRNVRGGQLQYICNGHATTFEASWCISSFKFRPRLSASLVEGSWYYDCGKTGYRSFGFLFEIALLVPRFFRFVWNGKVRCRQDTSFSSIVTSRAWPVRTAPCNYHFSYNLQTKSSRFKSHTLTTNSSIPQKLTPQTTTMPVHPSEEYTGGSTSFPHLSLNQVLY